MIIDQKVHFDMSLHFPGIFTEVKQQAKVLFCLFLDSFYLFFYWSFYFTERLFSKVWQYCLKVCNWLQKVELISSVEELNVSYNGETKGDEAPEVNDQCSCYTETCQLICRANQLTGFYIMGTLVVKGLTPTIAARVTETNLQPSQISVTGLSKSRFLFL